MSVPRGAHAYWGGRGRLLGSRWTRPLSAHECVVNHARVPGRELTATRILSNGATGADCGRSVVVGVRWSPSPKGPTVTRKLCTGPIVDVSFDLEVRRQHSRCVRGMPEVFDTSARPWIDSGAADTRRRPTGCAPSSRPAPRGAGDRRAPGLTIRTAPPGRSGVGSDLLEQVRHERRDG